jgi:predicted nucleic acid-binding protein
MILIDTGPFVALCDKRDALHRKAVSHLDGLIGSPMITCEPVLTEACFHLNTTAERRRLAALLDRLNVGAAPVVPDARYRARVFDWMARYAEHDPDWTDGCIAVLSAAEPSLRVWTYDGEFRTTWRRSDGSAIPLALS